MNKIHFMVSESAEQGQSSAAAPMARRKAVWARMLPVALLLAGLLLAWATGILDYLSFETLRSNRETLQALVSQHPAASVLAFIGLYTVAVALSLPVGSFLTITGGFLFGNIWGTSYVVVAATIGATLVYLAARFAFQDLMRARAGDMLRRMEKGFAANAFNYLMVLRLVPLFPFWLVNLVPALLGVRFASFVLGTAIGIIPGTFVYVSIGDGLGAIFDQGQMPDLGMIYSARILTPIIGLALLALVPVAYRMIRQNSAGKPRK